MSRRVRRMLVLCILLSAVTLGVLDHRYGQPLRQQIYHWGPDYHDWQTYHGRTFRVVNVVDGDTLDIDSPDGDTLITRVRLMGIDTPELSHSDEELEEFFAAEAREFTLQRAMDREVTLWLDDVGDVRGVYGRLLAYVQLPDGMILNEVLIREGFAAAMTQYPHSRMDAYVQLQHDAQSHDRGMWKTP